MGPIKQISLTFRYFDSSVLNFLQKFHQHQNALLTNVNIKTFQPLSERLHQILAQILPLIGDNIDSLEFYDPSILAFAYSRILYDNQCSGNNDEFSGLITKILTQTRILSISRFLFFIY
jgi:hypothetical protein